MLQKKNKYNNDDTQETETTGAQTKQVRKCASCGKPISSKRKSDFCQRCDRKRTEKGLGIAGTAMTVGGIAVKKYGPKVLQAVIKIVKK